MLITQIITPVTKHLLDQLSAFKLWFTSAVLENNLLNNLVTRLHLELLDFGFPLFKGLTSEKQSDQPKLYLLDKRITTVFQTLVESCLKDSYLKSTPLSNVRVRNPANFVPLEDTYLSGRVALSLQADHGINQQEQFQAKKFYNEGASQIPKRLYFSDPTLQCSSAMDLSRVLLKSVSSIAPLANFFPRIIPSNDANELDHE